MKVSVVTPSFNQARFIGRTLDSVASQQGTAHDHFVRDAASRDGTVALLEARGAALRWLSGPDAGQADAVNQAIAATDGEIIGWLNSDDVYYPGALAAVTECFAAHPGVDVIYGEADHIDEDDRVIEPYPTEPWDFERLTHACFVCQPAAFFRRRVVEAHGALDASLHYCMDYEYWIRLAQRGARFHYLRRKLAGSRLHAETKTLGAREKVHAEINGMLRRRLGRVPANWLLNYGYAKVDASTPAGRRAAWRRPRAWLAALAAARRWR